MARRKKKRGTKKEKESKALVPLQHYYGEPHRFEEHEEELKKLGGFERGPDYVEFDCGCTSKNHGDYSGKLRINMYGTFSINCHCFPGCTQVNLTPDEFEKHSEKGGTRNWKNNIWVHANDEKTPLRKTSLLQYYRHASNAANTLSVAKRKHIFHRDEYIRCYICKKERRFRRNNDHEIRIHHDALKKRKWKCSFYPYAKITCNDGEERDINVHYRGCTRNAQCQGCKVCNCTGCFKCRFINCNCRTCLDFIINADP